jgi:hypothetical protein
MAKAQSRSRVDESLASFERRARANGHTCELTLDEIRDGLM